MISSRISSFSACSSSHSFVDTTAVFKVVQPVKGRFYTRSNVRGFVVLKITAADSEESPPKKTGSFRKRGRPRRDSMPDQDMPALNMEDLYSSSLLRNKGQGSNPFDLDPMMDPLAEDSTSGSGGWLGSSTSSSPPLPPPSITAPAGSIEEKVQRVLSCQPADPEFSPDQEIMDLEHYIIEGGGNRYNLVLGIAARARAQEEQHLQNPTALGDQTKPIDRAICEMAREMDNFGGKLSELHVTYPKQYFKRYGK
eukprot:CAMPEP_0196587340 /NCGR_PEP_ID=MMETSP1081-20130531/57162_1 /TAXON_ID=36882 /ORGANISM="Pyramimonas amylifera, Strain CCMP720" /LENGTH=252 /DNA_ID=CAMNT_0041909499 /DNA_START=120 /DNA_END=878 /DNA_ORIENTATION=+